MMKAKISAVITTFKRSFKQIQPAIESALTQTYPCQDIWVVDDNGQGTPLQQTLAQEIKMHYGEKIGYLANKQSVGAQVARNRGIFKCQGEFICFLDDDDTWKKEKNARQIALFADATVGLVYADGYDVIINEQGQQTTSLYRTRRKYLHEIRHEDLLYGNYLGTTSQVMVRKQALLRCGIFDPQLPAAQDYDLWIRISKQYRCVGVPIPLFSYYTHTGQQISKQPTKAIIGHEIIYRKNKDEMSLTDKWHLNYLIFRKCWEAKKGRLLAWYTLKMLFWGGLAVLFDNRNLLQRLSSRQYEG